MDGDTKKYMLEFQIIKHWNIYINKCINDILEEPLLKAIYATANNKKGEIKKARNLLIYYNTYILGIEKITSYEIFPKSEHLYKYIDVLYTNINQSNNIISKDKLEVLIDIMKNNSKMIKKEIKKIHSIIKISNKKINVDTKYDSHKNIVKLRVIDKEYSVKYIIPGIHYDKLKRIYIGNSDYFDLWVCILLTRYNYYGVTKEGMCLCIKETYDYIIKNGYEEVTLECFAGALNSNLKNYCSLFYDIEEKFSSKGSFFNQHIKNFKYNIIVVNPPYITEVISLASDKILSLLDSCNNISVIMSIPDFRSINERSEDNISPALIKLNERTQFRESGEIIYYGYNILRHSKYFKYTISIGYYDYYNFFRNDSSGINSDTLFVLLSNSDEPFIENFKEYFVESVKNKHII